MSNQAAVPVAARGTGHRRHWWMRARRLGAPPKRVVMWSMISSGPIALVVVAGAILTYHGHSLLVESRQRVDHTYQVLAGLNKLFISVEDAETGQRGFIITGEDAYLEPYLSAVGQTSGHIANLRRLLDSSPIQAARVAQLDSLVEAKLAELGDVIEIRRREGFQGASNAITKREGKQLMDKVRAEVAGIGASEEAQLRAQQEDARLREREILRVGSIVAAASVLVRLGLAFFLARLRARAERPL
ncbi:CHASE3 domain-containing protein [Variovorax sp. RHLX14]|uniref:CHASE3 domain-containing protein n=1 Tax=Variovorax sp. RHLX14 TaxID=1259731 RepID=UPI003F46DB87